jgi:orotate phosphoribosyltransferase
MRSADHTLRRLLNARDGHFLFESGHHGRLLLDLDAMFGDPVAVEPLVLALAESIRGHGAQVVVGPLVGGSLLGYRIAERLRVPFAYTEREAGTATRMYPTRYRLPATMRSQVAGRRVAVVDDVVNAGSAVRATSAAVRAAGGEPVLVAALLRLGETALRHRDLAGVPLRTLAVWPNVLWEPGECPDCAVGVPLDEPGTG